MAEQFLRLMLECGTPSEDLDFLNGKGKVVNHVVRSGDVKSTLFTGSRRVAELLSKELHGRVSSYLFEKRIDWTGFS